jgi:hypothetical protein
MSGINTMPLGTTHNQRKTFRTGQHAPSGCGKKDGLFIHFNGQKHRVALALNQHSD